MDIRLREKPPQKLFPTDIVFQTHFWSGVKSHLGWKTRAFDLEIAKQEAAQKDTEALRILQKGRDAVIPDQPTAKQKAKETVDYLQKIAEGAKKNWLLFCKLPFKIYCNGTKLKVNKVNSWEINFMANRIDKEKLKEVHDQGVRSVDIAKKMCVSQAAVCKMLKKMGPDGRCHHDGGSAQDRKEATQCSRSASEDQRLRE
jgi:hypothetical protein